MKPVRTSIAILLLAAFAVVGRPPVCAQQPPGGSDVLLTTMEKELRRGQSEPAQQDPAQYRLSPRLLYRIWVTDGREELVRGAVFGDLDIRSLRSDLIAAGNALNVEQHFEPVAYSIASPVLLFDELQIKRSQAPKQHLPEYPAPPLGQGRE